MLINQIWRSRHGKSGNIIVMNFYIGKGCELCVSVPKRIS